MFIQIDYFTILILKLMLIYFLKNKNVLERSEIHPIIIKFSFRTEFIYRQTLNNLYCTFSKILSNSFIIFLDKHER